MPSHIGAMTVCALADRFAVVEVKGSPAPGLPHTASGAMRSAAASAALKRSGFDIGASA